MSAAEEEVVKVESHGVKRPAEEVHSVNNWEAANLGDDERKQKFLRLMGASKKEHHGKFVIGDQAEKPKHTDASERAEQITHALEDQYLQSLEMKLTGASRHHKGLGFHEPEEDKEKEESESRGEEKESDKSEDSSNGSSHECSDSKDSEKSDKKEDSSPDTDKNKDEDAVTEKGKNETKKKSYLAGFVKSSS